MIITYTTCPMKSMNPSPDLGTPCSGLLGGIVSHCTIGTIIIITITMIIIIIIGSFMLIDRSSSSLPVGELELPNCP